MTPAGFRRTMAAFFLRDLQVNVSYKLPFAIEIVGTFLTVVTMWFVAKIVDPALVPQNPLSRNVVQRTATAAAVSLMTLVVLAFFLEYLGTLRTRDAHAG